VEAGRQIRVEVVPAQAELLVVRYNGGLGCGRGLDDNLGGALFLVAQAVVHGLDLVAGGGARLLALHPLSRYLLLLYMRCCWRRAGFLRRLRRRIVLKKNIGFLIINIYFRNK